MAEIGLPHEFEARTDPTEIVRAVKAHGVVAIHGMLLDDVNRLTDIVDDRLAHDDRVVKGSDGRQFDSLELPLNLGLNRQVIEHSLDVAEDAAVKERLRRELLLFDTAVTLANIVRSADASPDVGRPFIPNRLILARYGSSDSTARVNSPSIMGYAIALTLSGSQLFKFQRPDGTMEEFQMEQGTVTVIRGSDGTHDSIRPFFQTNRSMFPRRMIAVRQQPSSWND